jgi:hypothetical protein
VVKEAESARGLVRGSARGENDVQRSLSDREENAMEMESENQSDADGEEGEMEYGKVVFVVLWEVDHDEPGSDYACHYSYVGLSQRDGWVTLLYPILSPDAPYLPLVGEACLFPSSQPPILPFALSSSLPPLPFAYPSLPSLPVFAVYSPPASPYQRPLLLDSQFECQVPKPSC